MKLNTDTTIFRDKGTFSVAVLARDDEGLAEAIIVCRRRIVRPEITEAIRVREALSWLKKKNWERVVIESDCLLVI